MTTQSDSRLKAEVDKQVVSKDTLDSRIGADGKCKDAFEITPQAYMCYSRAKCQYEMFQGTLKFCRRYLKNE